MWMWMWASYVHCFSGDHHALPSVLHLMMVRFLWWGFSKPSFVCMHMLMLIWALTCTLCCSKHSHLLCCGDSSAPCCGGALGPGLCACKCEHEHVHCCCSKAFSYIRLFCDDGTLLVVVVVCSILDCLDVNLKIHMCKHFLTFSCLVTMVQCPWW